MDKKKLWLTRVYSDDKATFGVLNFEGSPPFAITLELPWVNNERNYSCIPDGEYECGRVDSPKFGKTFEILSVPDRSHILFHKGNLAVDTRGCVLVAENFDILSGAPGIGNSRHGFGEFMKTLEGDDKFDLRIITARDSLTGLTAQKVYRKPKGAKPIKRN